MAPLPCAGVRIALGRPRFRDAALGSIASASGIDYAWAAALDRPDHMEVLTEVHGDFAVAFARADGSTVMAVDRFAVRSLCYRIIDGVLHVAERADQLATLHPTAEIDPQSIFDYLYFHVVPSPRTVFKGVQRLPAGHCATFSRGEVTVRPYWAPRFSEERQPEFAGLAQQFRTVIRAAVERQLDGSKPACFLSGGTDSSTVAGMIGQACGKPAATYSIGFEAEGYDEMAFARIAAKRFGTEHHEYYVTPDDLVRSIPAVAAHYDQPFGNSSALPAYYCAKMARADGVSRLLAGDGGKICHRVDLGAHVSHLRGSKDVLQLGFECGELFICGRLKDLVILRGRNLIPSGNRIVLRRRGIVLFRNRIIPPNEKRSKPK